MSPRQLVRAWPLIGVAVMLLLGWAVRTGPTALDRWFQGFRHGPAQWLLLLTDPWLLLILWSVAMVVAIGARRWRLCLAAVASPVLAYLIVQAFKRLFGRTKGGELAYPSGHTTVMVVVLGLLVLALGTATWLLVGCVVYGVLGAVGQGSTYHWFTDTVGALFLGTAIVCVTAVLVRRPVADST